MDLNLEGKHVLVTGGSRGIGRACAEAFAAEGAVVRIASRNPPPDLPYAAKAVDLAAPGSAEALAEWAGELDILVNNAGAIPGGTLLGVDEATWRRAWDLKVFGYVNLTRLVYARMKARRSGVIVNIIGAAGEKLDAAYIAGSTANAGLMAFTRALGGASHADGIRVVGINPGPVATERMTTLYRQRAQALHGDPERFGELFRDLSFGRPGAPEEIAAAALFLASDRSAYTSGCILTIDGGLSAR
ncbi:MAG TPA: short-chain dehydrogenase/reductase [Burkholderiales bacterium]|nr:short-chain dehydrogenase/reductase [Burkholderiales bacterium]